MDGFKPVVKMKCGGSVSKAVEKCGGGRMKEGGKVMHDDIKEDKKLVKKAFSLHDDQKHEGKTDLSALKKGGRAKKTEGTVRKYKCGGNVKKMADGSLTGALTSPAVQNIVNADVLRRRKMNTAPADGLGATPPGLAQAAATPGTQPPGPIMKKGGKVCK